VSRDVFEKDPFGIDFADDAGNVWPEVAFVICAFAISGGAERLAGISGKHCVDRAVQGPSVKGGDIIPDRRGREVSGALCGDDGVSRVLLPFDKASRVEIRLCKHKAHIKATGSGTQGQSVLGT
jgi:hypothetical protein